MAESFRQKILTQTFRKEYKKWLENPVTMKVIAVLKEETRILAIPATALTDPQVASALYHHRVGIDAAIRIIETIESAPEITDLEATYETKETTDDKASK
jgi:hypothetical protein